MAEGIFALLGVTLGALGKWWLDRSQRTASRRDARRLEALDLVSAFLRDADAVWRGRNRLGRAIAEMMADRSNREAAADRLAAFEDMAGPRRDAELALIRMRLVTPDLAPSAAALLIASDRYSIDHHDEHTSTRESALLALEEAARPLVR